MTKTRSGIGLAALGFVLLGMAIGYTLANIQPDSQANAMESETALAMLVPSEETQDEAQSISPVKALTDRDIYYPGTEDLRPDEMRITALGTQFHSRVEWNELRLRQ